MMTDVMLCVSFVIGIGIMYLAVHKMASVFSESFIDEEVQTEKVRASEGLKKQKAKKSRRERKAWRAQPQPEQRAPVVRAAEPARTDIKPRISLRERPRRDNKLPSVMIGNAKPYRVNMRKT